MKKLENNTHKKKYPLIPYLIGLLVTVVVLVLISYMAELRNTKGELLTIGEINTSAVTYTINKAE